MKLNHLTCAQALIQQNQDTAIITNAAQKMIIQGFVKQIDQNAGKITIVDITGEITISLGQRYQNVKQGDLVEATCVYNKQDSVRTTNIQIIEDAEQHIIHFVNCVGEQKKNKQEDLDNKNKNEEINNLFDFE